MGLNRIPIYLPDRTVIGHAQVTSNGHRITLDIPGSEPLADLISDEVVGLSVVYMNNEARDRMNEGEATDDGQ